MNGCFQAVSKNNNPLVVVSFRPITNRSPPHLQLSLFLCKKRIKKASILYVLEKTSIKQTIKEPKFLKKLWSCDGMYERWKLHRPSMKTVLSKGGYDD